ncbi:hypothetical protein A1O3_09273 [Capronia epimyces CBS 606.96]|uniref:HNH nuclease domain-containing protein n=1 Tax=Capronia epimyces CBS 606.96 TaxID=1182542 RepID=W9XC96_9EURO|nr:uncharacterized protein A1O3_09273 [Capronia epimyces CBS 606.96]EXJ78112.1 hypothetical protein A1O3_09273 [Capronia epimyces CBS 606.96]
MSNENPTLVWSPYPPPSHPQKTISQPACLSISIKHPGQDLPLLAFPPFDAGGVHHETVLVACGILVGNHWDGFLSSDREGQHSVSSSEKILREESYYYHPSRQPSELDYAVTPTFEHWRFPYGKLPPSWQQIPSFKQTSQPNDSNLCRVTQFEEGVEDAHLVPSSERRWFDNNLALYMNSARADALKAPVNMIRLRSDIHTVFDAKRFAIVPLDGRLIVYCLNYQLGSQFADLYHGVEIHQIRASPPVCQFLFARFAYTVFDTLRGFLVLNIPKKLRLFMNNQMETELCNPERCWRFAQYTACQGKSASASASPRKRPYPDAGPAYSDDDGMEEEFRGRKKSRSDETSSSADLSVKTPETTPFPASKIGKTTHVDNGDEHLILSSQGRGWGTAG